MQAVSARTLTSSSSAARSGRRPARSSTAPVRRDGECFVIDSPVLPARARGAADGRSSRRAGSCSGLLCTHGDWDHLLGPLRVPRRGARLRRDDRRAPARRARARRQRELREFDEENYVERPRPLSLGQVQALPVPGHVEIGDAEIELLPADGHTEDGMAIGCRGPGVARLRRLPVAGRDPVAVGERQPRRLPRDARAPAAARSSEADWVVPGPRRAARRRSARSRSCARTSPTSRRCPTRRRRCRSARRDRRRSARSTPRTSTRVARVSLQHTSPRDPPRGRRTAELALLGAARLRARRRRRGPARRSPRGSRAPARRSTCSTPTSRRSRRAGTSRSLRRRLRRDRRRRARGRLRRSADDAELWGAPRGFVRSPAGHRSRSWPARRRRRIRAHGRGPSRVTGATGGLGGRVAARLADHGVASACSSATRRARPTRARRGRDLRGYDDADGVRARARRRRHAAARLGRRAPRPRAAAPRGGRRRGRGRRRAASSTRRSSAPRPTARSRSAATTSTPRSTSGPPGSRYTFLRDNLYLDLSRCCAGADGVIRGPAGDGRVAAVARDDIADVAAAVLDRRRPRRPDLRPHRRREAFTLAEARPS